MTLSNQYESVIKIVPQRLHSQICQQRIFQDVTIFVTHLENLICVYLFPTLVVGNERNGPHIIQSGIAVISSKDPELSIINSRTMCGSGNWEALAAPDSTSGCSLAGKGLSKIFSEKEDKVKEVQLREFKA